MTPAPIALFAYRRPDHLRATVEALKRNEGASSSRLFVFSDAARDERSADAVAKVRHYARTISGFADVQVIERPANLGLANSIIDGVTRLCADAGNVVVLEDDLIVSPHFLSYMHRALETYADDERVMQVSGYMFPVNLLAEADALFLPFTTSWGWACWQRSWLRFDPAARGIGRLERDQGLRRQFNLDGAYDYFGMLKAQQSGKVDSWAIRWYLSVFIANGLTLYPARSLVANTGFDGTGTHGTAPMRTDVDLDPQFRVQRLPRTVEVTPAMRDIIEHIRASSTPGAWTRLRNSLYGLLAKS